MWAADALCWAGRAGGIKYHGEIIRPNPRGRDFLICVGPGLGCDSADPELHRGTDCPNRLDRQRDRPERFEILGISPLDDEKARTTIR